MSQDRYHRPPGLNTGSLGISVGITGAMILGLIFAAPHITGRPVETHLTLDNIVVPPPPPVDEVKPLPRTQVDRPLVSPTPLVKPTTSEPPLLTQPMTDLGPVMPPLPPGPMPSASPAAAEAVAPPAPPVMVDAQIDSRYAAALQPPYPAEERRAEHEGRVVVRVLIGVDGRVIKVERRSADSDAFYRETERQALGKWRFKPATRDGIPVEAWRVMSIRFVLQNE